MAAEGSNGGGQFNLLQGASVAELEYREIFQQLGPAPFGGVDFDAGMQDPARGPPRQGGKEDISVGCYDDACAMRQNPSTFPPHRCPPTFRLSVGPGSERRPCAHPGGHQPHLPRDRPWLLPGMAGHEDRLFPIQYSRQSPPEFADRHHLLRGHGSPPGSRPFRRGRKTSDMRGNLSILRPAWSDRRHGGCARAPGCFI